MKIQKMITMNLQRKKLMLVEIKMMMRMIVE